MKTQTPSKARKKTRTPSSRALESETRKVLRAILVAILTTPALRRKAGVSLRGKDQVSLTCDIDFITAGRMKTVNRKYRGKEASTDVLSFPAPSPFREQGMLGELLICTPVLLKQARELGHPWKVELSVLLVHGLLHLLDFDHERGPKQAREMARWEKKLLQAPGLIERTGPRG